MDDLQRLADDLTVISRRVDAAIAPVVKRAAVNIKTQARATVAQSHSNPGKKAAGQAITFTTSADGLEVEIGYEHRRAGPLGTFNEYGSVNNTPDWALNGALLVEAERVGHFLAEAVVKLWR